MGMQLFEHDEDDGQLSMFGLGEDDGQLSVFGLREDEGQLSVFASGGDDGQLSELGFKEDDGRQVKRQQAAEEKTPSASGGAGVRVKRCGSCGKMLFAREEAGCYSSACNACGIRYIQRV